MKRSEWADGWWNQAKHDLEAAKVLNEAGFYDTCALLCQQAVEKAIKAVWIDSRNTEPPRTHWAERLAAELGAPDSVVDAASMLVADYTASRYPGPTFESPYSFYDAEHADAGIECAESALTWAESFWEKTDE